MKANRLLVSMLFGIGLTGVSSGGFAQVDEAAATATLKRNNCTKCHAVDKAKKGPAFKKVAEKYKGKADAENKLHDMVTKEPTVKFDDGTEEKHKVIDTQDPKELKNLFQYILSR